MAIYTRIRNDLSLWRHLSVTAHIPHRPHRRSTQAFGAALVTALVAVTALPAYAGEGNSAGLSTPQAQSIWVHGAPPRAESIAELDNVTWAAASGTDSYGPSVAALLARPRFSAVSGAAIYREALSYLGTPYRFGGDSPAGFDCSGYIQYVYAEFGIALPHSAARQALRGRVIPESQARAGDIVVMDGHNGFWAGVGLILHAPEPGARVRVQGIWSRYEVVRILG